MLLCESYATRFDDEWDRIAAVVSMMTKLGSKTPITIEEARPPRRAKAAPQKVLTKGEAQRELRSLKALFRE